MFTFWPGKDGKKIPMGTYSSRLVQWEIDPKATDIKLGEPNVLIDNDNEFMRIYDRMVGQKNKYVFGLYCDKKNSTTQWKTIVERVGGNSNPLLVTT